MGWCTSIRPLLGLAREAELGTHDPLAGGQAGRPVRRLRGVPPLLVEARVGVGEADEGPPIVTGRAEHRGGLLGAHHERPCAKRYDASTMPVTTASSASSRGP